jgi:hypothetical protein
VQGQHAKPRVYEVVLRDEEWSFFEGEVVTHLPLAEWAEWRGYKIVDILGSRPALVLERTSLAPRPVKISGPYSFALPEVLEIARRAGPKRSGH